MQQGTLAEENAVPMSGQRTWPGPHHDVSGRGRLLGFMPRPETYEHVLFFLDVEPVGGQQAPQQ